MGTILGTILGIATVIFGLVLTIAIGYRVLNFDFDVPLFKTEVTVSFKSEDDQADKKEEEKR